MTVSPPAAPAEPVARGSYEPVVPRSYAPKPSPVDAGIEVTSVARSAPDAGGGGVLSAVATVAIDGTEPVFAGHYPDFPIFPGVCIVECVQRAALAVAERSGMPEPRLLAVESTRFLGAVRPDDLLTVRLELRDHEGAVRCRATASTERGEAASVRLRLSGEVAV
ncbi:3-hydroxyacyl-ACP dehydratase FabZ family protein [Streptomyces sp. NPDC056188]|uniref:3-hydroxyacyl-ACP dehydratase FabZ family protein n=1 Tax=Streptomyces sp. NPDC056188 TaxID=3345740 RepID=UPI0035D67295